MKVHPDLRKPLRAARKAGWGVEFTKGGHIRVTPPDGPYIIMSATPSDGHATKNAKADLRRAGLTW